MSLEVFNPRLYDDFIDVPVNGSFTSSDNNVRFNTSDDSFTVNNLRVRFNSTSPLFSGSTLLDLDNVKFKPLAFGNSINNSRYRLVVGIVTLATVGTPGIPLPASYDFVVIGYYTGNNLFVQGTQVIANNNNTSGFTVTAYVSISGNIGNPTVRLVVSTTTNNTAAFSGNNAVTTTTNDNIFYTFAATNFISNNNNGYSVGGTLVLLFPNPSTNNFVVGNNALSLYNLYSSVLVDITDNNKVIAKALLNLTAISPVNIQSPSPNSSVLLQQIADIGISGYFTGFITLTGNGLLKVLPDSLELNTSCTEINNVFKSLFSNIKSLANDHGNISVTRILCDVVITIPSIILALSKQFNVACNCSKKTKCTLNKTLSNVLNKLNDIVSSIQKPSNDNGVLSFSITFVYEINRIISVLNHLVEHQLSGLSCSDVSTDDCDNTSTNDKSSTKHNDKDKDKHNDKDKDNLNMILQKLSGLESTLTRINQTTNNTRKQFNELQQKVLQQDEIVKKVAKCVLKK
jgi:hypothetical protein